MIARLHAWWSRRRTLRRLRHALATMEEGPRAVFVRARFRDMAYPEIAAELGISEKEVEQRLAAALTHIMRHVDEGGR